MAAERDGLPTSRPVQCVKQPSCNDASCRLVTENLSWQHDSVWNFLITRVRSEKTVENIRRNIVVQGEESDGGGAKEDAVKLARGKRREKESSEENSKEGALQERDLAEKEVERLRHIVRQQRRELKARMLEVSREEAAERKRMIDERSNYRHKQVMLETYDQQCDGASRIFSEYHKRLRHYINLARDSQRSNVDSCIDAGNNYNGKSEKEAVYSTVKGNKAADDVILVETIQERNIRKACEWLALRTIEKIRSSFPATRELASIPIHSWKLPS